METNVGCNQHCRYGWRTQHGCGKQTMANTTMCEAVLHLLPLLMARKQGYGHPLSNFSTAVCKNALTNLCAIHPFYCWHPQKFWIISSVFFSGNTRTEVILKSRIEMLRYMEVMNMWCSMDIRLQKIKYFVISKISQRRDLTIAQE